MRAGPSPAFCVEVKPRKSSALSGIRSAPPTPAAKAIRFGRLWPPSKPPPAKPRLMLVGRQKSSLSTSCLAPSAIAARLSERSSRTASCCSRIVCGGSLGKRIASSSARVGLPFAFEAR